MSYTDDLEAELGLEKPKGKAKSKPGNGHSGESWYALVNARSVEEVLDWLGVERNDEGHVKCPKCGNYDSSSAIVDGGVKCLHDTCSSDGPTGKPGFRTNVDLTMLVRGVESLEAVKELAEHFNVELPRSQPTPAATPKAKPKLRAVTEDDQPPLFDEPAKWQDGLKYNKHGVAKTIANIDLILTMHEEWKDVLVYDSFACRTLAVKTEDGRTPPCTETGHWRDVDTTRVRVWLAQNYGIEVGGDLVDAVVESVACRQQRHPVREYLDGLTWDGVQRLPYFLSSYFGCPKTAYYEEIGKMWMISGVARVRQPGCQADYVLVLVSPEQGLRKSTAIRILGKGWGADTSVRIGDKDALLALQGVWVLELAELSSIRGAQDIEAVKAFVTSRIDHFRAPFARRVQDWARQCIFAGTVNEHECLADPSGNRRFWPADCGQIDTDGLTAIVDQLWAEADARYKSGEPWYPTTKELHVQLREVQDDHAQEDGWLGSVQTWLADPHRIIRIDKDNYTRVDLANGVTTSEVLRGALAVQPDRCTRSNSTHMGHILRQCGMVSRRPRGNTSRARKYFMATEIGPTGPIGSNHDGPVAGQHESAQLPLQVQLVQPNVSHHIQDIDSNATGPGSVESDHSASMENSISVGPVGPGKPEHEADTPCPRCGQWDSFCLC